MSKPKFGSDGHFLYTVYVEVKSKFALSAHYYAETCLYSFSIVQIASTKALLSLDTQTKYVHLFSKFTLYF